MKTKVQPGFKYLVQILDKAGNVRDTEVVHNLMPVQGLDHMVGVTLKGSAQLTSWYVGIYQGNYTPVGADTAATFPASATECTNYTAGTRPALTLGAVAAGSVDNGASRAEFVMSANRTLYGGFVASAAAKGSTAGVLLSAVRFTSPKALESGETLRVIAAFALTSN
ncbi:hypothetical protein [Polaromonas sp.]|uniref:hypothetical protein n=1 Tax=Polaromonas sp. TaxID=1869339 RepID=UPI003262E12D